MKVDGCTSSAFQIIRHGPVCIALQNRARSRACRVNISLVHGVQNLISSDPRASYIKMYQCAACTCHDYEGARALLVPVALIHKSIQDGTTIFRHLRHANFKIFSMVDNLRPFFSYFCTISICFKSVKNVSKFGVQGLFSSVMIWCVRQNSGVHLPCSADWQILVPNNSVTP